MNTALKAAGLLCLCLLAWSIFNAVQIEEDIQGQHIAEHISLGLQQVQSAAAAISVDLAQLKAEAKLYEPSLGPTRLNSISTAIERATGHSAAIARQLNLASAAQQKYWEAYPKQVSDSLGKLNSAIAETNSSLNKKCDDDGKNCGVLPATTIAIEQTGSTTKAASDSIQQLTVELQPSLKSFAELMSNPAFTKTAENLQAASGSMAIAGNNVAEGTALALKAEKTALAPASLIKRSVEEAVHLIGRFLGFSDFVSETSTMKEIDS